MKTLLKVMTAIAAVHYVIKVVTRKRPTKEITRVPHRIVSVVQVKHDSIATETFGSGDESSPVVECQKENTSDQYEVGVSVQAGSIPPYDIPDFIPCVAGDPFRKSDRRVGVHTDCSTNSPALEQRHRKNKNRKTKNRTRVQTPRFVIPEIEPSLVSAGFF